MAARLGNLRLYRVSVDNRTLVPGDRQSRPHRRPDADRAPRRRPAPRRDDARPRHLPRHAAHLDGRLGLVLHPRQRHRRALPRDPLGQPRAPVRSHQPRRSVHHPDRVPCHAQADDGPPDDGRASTPTRTSVSANGRVQTFVATNVRDLPLAMAPDFRVSTATVGDTRIRVYARPGAPSSALLAQARARHPAHRAPRRRPTRGRSTPSWNRPAATRWKDPAPRGSRAASTPASLPYLLAHETAHQWLPGLVGNDQWAEPFADEAVADMIARTTLNERRAPGARRTASTSTSRATRAPATTRSSTSRAATGSTTCAGGWATTCSGARCATTSTSDGSSWGRSGSCSTRSTRRRRSTFAARAEPFFPGVY